MLAAERAFLFLRDEGEGDLRPLAGRDQAGKDLQPEAVVSSVIGHVRQTQTPPQAEAAWRKPHEAA